MSKRNAKDRILELLRIHNIGFILNPGGARFLKGDKSLQVVIPYASEEEILEKLEKWIEKEGWK